MSRRHPPYGNEWAVRILLECILVYPKVIFAVIAEEKASPFKRPAVGYPSNMFCKIFHFRLQRNEICLDIGHLFCLIYQELEDHHRDRLYLQP